MGFALVGVGPLTPALPQALRTYQGYQAEALSAEAKLREAERQEEKRGGRPNPSSAPPGPPAGVGAKTPRRGSMTKGERLVEKVRGRGLGPVGLARGRA